MNDKAPGTGVPERKYEPEEEEEAGGCEGAKVDRKSRVMGMCDAVVLSAAALLPPVVIPPFPIPIGMR